MCNILNPIIPLYFLILLTTFEAKAQFSQNYYFHHLTHKEGLSQGWNWYFLNDSRGEMWVSSPNGLNRFDGVSVQTYTPDERLPGSLKGLNISGQFVEQANGDIWFGVEDMICRYVRLQDTFEHIPIILSGNNKIHSNCRVIGQDTYQKVWFLLEDGQFGFPICTFDPSTRLFQIECYISYNTNRCSIKYDEHGRVQYIFAFQWPSPGASLIKFTYQESKTNTTNTRLSDDKNCIQGRITDAIFMEDSLLYIAAETGLIKYSLSTGLAKNILRHKKLNCLANDAKGKLWLGTSDGNLLFFNTEQNLQIYKFDPNESGSLKKDPINHIYFDKSGNLWIAYRNEGVSWTNPAKSKFQVWYPPEIKNNTFISLTTDKSGNIWGAAGNSIYKIEKEFKINLKNSIHIPGRKIKKIMTDPIGRIWMHNDTSAQVWDTHSPNARIAAKRKEVYTEFIDFTILHHQDIIATTYAGAIEINEPIRNRFKTTQVDTSSVYASVYEDSAGTIYLCRGIRGICVLQKKAGAYVQIHPPLLLRGDINAWSEDKTSVWIACTNGLVCLNKNTFDAHLFNQKDDLPGLSITNIIADGDIGLWLSTNEKIAYFNKKTHAVTTFSIADGVPGSGIIPNVACKTSSGEILFGANRGLFEINTNNLLLFNGNPAVLMKKILVNDLPDSTLRCSENRCANPREIKNIKLPYSKSTLSFSFVAIEYSDPLNNRLEYRLIGLDTNWVKVDNPGFARFTNLPPGHYDLEIKAYNSEGRAGEKIYSLHIMITPPFWMTWWFYCLVAIFILLSALGFYQYRISQINKLQQIRQQITADLHDEIGPVLTGIRMFSDALRLRLGQEDKETKFILERIGANAHKTLSSFRDIIWAVNLKYDSLGDLSDRMREIVNDANESTDIHCNLSCRLHNPSLNINPRLRHNIFLIFKEVLHNSVKYSGASEIKIYLESNEKYLTLDFQENGCGFDMANIQPGNGLFNLEKRANELKGDFYFKSSPGNGVILKLSVRHS
ncbi:MAG: triple tyrosine motif-containing protein [Bacteroidota bacterium]